MTSHIPSHPKARAVEAGGALGRGPECEPENLSVDAGAEGDAAQIVLFWPRGLRVRPSRSDLRALRRNFWGVARVRSTGVNKYFASCRALDLSLLVTWLNCLLSRNEFRTTMAHWFFELSAQALLASAALRAGSRSNSRLLSADAPAGTRKTFVSCPLSA